jgi:ubiquinone/menaquinone biosynthesis C-methylase UbiE
VLEIGFGSGLNLPLYTRPTMLVGLDPSFLALSMSRVAARNAACRVELLKASAEAIPLASYSVDTVVTAWVLCTIPDVVRALQEIRRVLKPSGSFLFVEHGRSPDSNVARWQGCLTPVWKHIAGGCHLNRAIGQLIEDAGFRFERMQTSYMSGLRPMTFMYEGHARPT